MSQPVSVTSASPDFPRDRLASLGHAAPTAIDVLGNRELLAVPAVGLFCSARCPGTLIVEGYDLAVALRNAGTATIGGFHSPMEKECLELLLRGTQPITIVLARSLSRMKVPSDWKKPLAAGRLLLMSASGERERRVTALAAARRNELVAALADRLLIIHARANSSTFALCERALGRGKPVYAIDSPHNEPLGRLGATLIPPEDLGASFAMRA